MENYYVVENGRNTGLPKEIEVLDNLIRAKKMSNNLPDGSYRTIKKQEARKIAKRTQWGLLPKDLTEMFN